MGVCWFVVPMCSGFGVGAVRDAAVSNVFRDGRYPSASVQSDLAVKQVTFSLVLSMACLIRYVFTVCDFAFSNVF